MSVTTEANRTAELTTDGAETEFDFDMLIHADDELEVWYEVTSGSYTQLVLDTNYTVVFTEDGGTVTTIGDDSPYAAGVILIIRHLPITQQTAWILNDNHTGPQHEDDFDRAVMRDLQIQEQLDRAVGFAITSSTKDIEFPEPLSDNVIGWNTAATALENKDPVSGIVALPAADGNFIVGDGTNFVVESGATARASLGVTIGTDVLAWQAIGIADDNLLEVDGTPNDDEYAKFTANGLEGRTVTENRDDLGLGTGDSPTWTGATISGLTAGRIPIVSTGGLLADDGGLLWDNTNKLLTVTSGAATATIFSSTHLGNPGATDYTSRWYNNSVLRSNLRASGIQEWWLNSGAGEVGKIAYTTPSGLPGIAIFGTDEDDRAYMLLDGDDMTLGASTGGGTPQQVRITDAAEGNLLLSTNGALLLPSEVFTGFRAQGNTVFEVAKTTAVATSAPFPAIILSKNLTGTAHVVGQFVFANTSLSGEQRLALLAAYTNGATNSGSLRIFTTNAGTLGERVRITSAGIMRVFNKVSFTQTDDNEYIDSLADGYMDYGATTGHRFNAPVGIGTTAPDSIFHIKANVPGTVGSHPAGQLIIQDPDDTVFGNAVITGYESDGAGNPDQQLWYLGSSSSSDSNIIFLNRRNSKLQLGTNGVSQLTILGDGKVGINEAAPQDTLEVNGTVLVKDKLKFTQDDGNEFIDSLNDGYMDYGATTAHRFNTTIEVATKAKITSIGGYAIKLTNTTGAVTVQGQTVKADPATNDAVILTAADDPECIGVFLDAGVADDAEAWVVVSGIADIAMEDNTAATRGNWVQTSETEAGYADSTDTSPQAAPQHFNEIGHCIESVAAGGGGTHILARCVLHFN